MQNVIKNIGKLGEDTACRYLENKGHNVIERNFRVRLGEIDIVSKKGGTLFFIEVKSTLNNKKDFSPQDFQGPERNVHAEKKKKLSRAVQIFLRKRLKDIEVNWEFWVIAVVFDLEKRTAHVKVIQEVLEE